MGGEAGGLGRDALHHVAVAADGVDVEVVQGEVGLVVVLGEPEAGRGHADAGGHALAERAGGRLDAGRQVRLGVAGGLAVDLAELLEVVERQGRGVEDLDPLLDVVHAGEVDQRVEQHRRVPDRQDEPVAVGPQRVGRVVAEEVLPERVAQRRQRHRRPRVARVRRLDRVHRQGPDRVDALQVDVVVLVRGHPVAPCRSLRLQGESAIIGGPGRQDPPRSPSRDTIITTDPPAWQGVDPDPAARRLTPAGRRPRSSR